MAECSPILLDLLGNGFSLTDINGGVSFDLHATGTKLQLPWTSIGSDDAWLVLDRNGNGTIDDGRELFGGVTPQPVRWDANGFLALAEYDTPLKGGNGDGIIDSRDAIFSSLRLWQDISHDGFSQPNELFTLTAVGVASIELDYKESRRQDRYGNWFKYRAKVHGTKGARLGPWAYDVILTCKSCNK